LGHVDGENLMSAAGSCTDVILGAIIGETIIAIIAIVIAVAPITINRFSHEQAIRYVHGSTGEATSGLVQFVDQRYESPRPVGTRQCQSGNVFDHHDSEVFRDGVVIRTAQFDIA
jgi:hypothetical protein